MGDLTQIQTFVLLILAIIAIRYMWQDMWAYFSRRESNKALTEIMDKLGRELKNGGNKSRRNESSSKKPSKRS